MSNRKFITKDQAKESYPDNVNSFTHNGITFTLNNEIPKNVGYIIKDEQAEITPEQMRNALLHYSRMNYNFKGLKRLKRWVSRYPDTMEVNVDPIRRLIVLMGYNEKTNKCLAYSIYLEKIEDFMNGKWFRQFRRQAKKEGMI